MYQIQILMYFFIFLFFLFFQNNNIILNIKNYGKYWTPKQVEELVRTSPQNINKIREWLEDHSVTECRVQNGDLLKCEAPATIIEELFDIELYNLRSLKKEGVLSVTHFGRISIPSRVIFYFIFILRVIFFLNSIENSS